MEAIARVRSALEECAQQAEGERQRLAQIALENWEQLLATPLTPEVLQLTLREIAKITTIPEFVLAPGGAARKEFLALAEARRFVAGQLHWDRSGAP